MPLSHPNSPRDHAPYPHVSHPLGPSSASAPTTSSSASTSTAPNKNSGANGANGDGSNKDKDGAGGKARKRPPSCNLCRIRKVKCIRDEPTARCESCIALNRTCEYGPSRRPGPVSRYARPASPELGASDMDPHRPGPSSHGYHQYDHGHARRSSRSPPARDRGPRDASLAYSAYPPPPPLPHSQSHPNLPAHLVPRDYPPSHPHGHSHSQSLQYPPPSGSQSHQVTPSTSDPDRRQSSHSTPASASHRAGSFDFPIYPPPLSSGPSSSAGGGGAGGVMGPPHSGSHQLPPFDSSFPLDPIATQPPPTSGSGGGDAGLDWLGLPISPYSSMLYSVGAGASMGEGFGPSPQRTTYSAASAEAIGSVEPMSGSGGGGHGGGTGSSMGPPHLPGTGGRGTSGGQAGHGPDWFEGEMYGGRHGAGGGGGSGGGHRGSMGMDSAGHGYKKESSRHTSVEDVVAWSVVMRILDAYHINLYPLMPIVHWPSFLQLLISREDERNVAWRAMLFSLIAYSIIQLPRPVLAFIDVRDLRRLHQKCHSLSHAQRNHEYSTITVLDLTTLYCEHIYLSTMGRQNAANGVLAQAIRLSQTLNLHDDRLDNEGNCVDREVRRRVFWLLYGSDRTISALTGCPLHFSESDIHLPLPLAVDDNLITTSGAFPQAPHITSVLAGFHYASRLFHLLGAVLTAQHSLPATAAGGSTEGAATPTLPPLHPPVRPAIHFQDALETILADLPEPLRLSFDGSGRLPSQAAGPGAAGGTGMEASSSAAGSSSGQPAGEKTGPVGQASAFEICKANLLVSQAMVRFAIQQYAVAIGENWDDLHGREWTEKNVLNMLESMSSESLAANGESLRHKILSFVASSFLDRYPGTSENHTLFLEFLGLYDRIREVQQAAELEAPESRVPSRAATPAGMAMSSITH